MFSFVFFWSNYSCRLMIFWITICLACPAHWFFNFKKNRLLRKKWGAIGNLFGLEKVEAWSWQRLPRRVSHETWWAIVTKLKIYDKYIVDDIMIISPSLSIGEPPLRRWNDTRESYSPFITIGSVVYRPNPKHSWPASKYYTHQKQGFFLGLIKGQTKWFFIPP